MHKRTYEIEYLITDQLTIDFDKLIDAVKSEVLDEDSPDDLIDDIIIVFGDNIDYFLEECNIIDDSDKIYDSVKEEIYKEFVKRVYDTEDKIKN